MTVASTPDAPDRPGPLDSRIVKAGDLPWEPTRLPGISVKTLMVDRAAGLVTTLMRMEPGAVLPDHEHVLIEQTFVLEGTLVDHEGPEAGLAVGAGEFVWRPAGSRHAAWSPGGCVTLAIFQIPNKFFERDGSIVDILGNDWGEAWSHALATPVHRGRSAG